MGGLTVVVVAVLMVLGSTAVTNSKVPITESVTIGEGDTEAKFTADDIGYNICSPYDPKKYGKVKVCGANTKVNIYLRGRCQGYQAYRESIGSCTGATTENCQEVDPSMSHWLGAAQSYEVVQCGAGQGEVHDYKGPACKGMAECAEYAAKQAEQEKMDKMEGDMKEGWTGKGHVMKMGRKLKMENDLD